MRVLSVTFSHSATFPQATDNGTVTVWSTERDTVRFSGRVQHLSLLSDYRRAREEEDTMDLKYTEVPGAWLVTIMSACWVLMLLIAVISAIVK